MSLEFALGVWSRRQNDESVAPRCEPRIVAEALDQGVMIERLLHDAALDADPAAVDQPHFRQTRRVSLVDVFLDH